MSQPPDPSVPPQYPEPPAPPQYPESSAPPQYPEPTYPEATAPAPPVHPTPPATPSATPPSYPGEPTYPTAAPQYPAAPGHPAPPATPPPYPDEPTYPTAAPQYPAAAPGHPTTPPVPPAYPTAPPAPADQPAAHPAGGPAYPGHIPPEPPQYPAPGYPVPPQTAAVPPPPSHAPGASAPVPEPAPDDLDYRHRGARLHVAEYQRGADATAIGRLAVQLPGALVSLALVSSIALGLFGNVVGTVAVVAWVASGLLVFHRPTELAFARYVLKLRPPTQAERFRLEPIWNEVTARAGIEPGTYELMVENSDELNAVAVAGHVVGVTTYSLNRIPTSNLAAVLAHELGHHTGGHAWAGLLGYWYSLPGRIAWAVTRGLARFAIAVASVFSMAATGILVLFMAVVVIAAFLTAWYLAIPLVLAPYLLAYAGRRGELRADQQAAELGFARQLAEVLHHSQAEEAAAKAALAAQGQRLKEPGTLARLLSSHPDDHTRLSALEPYLGLHR